MIHHPAVLPPATACRIDRDGAAQAFLTRTASLRTGSPHTRRAYRADLGQYFDWLDAHGHSFTQVSHRAASHYLDHLSGLGLQARSINRKVSAIRSFYRHMQALRVASINPFSMVKTPGVDAKSEVHKVLSHDEFEAVLRALRTAVTRALATLRTHPRSRQARRALFYGLRRRAMVVLFATSGIRRWELLTLPEGAIERADHGFRLVVIGKHDKQRAIPVPPQALPALHDWLSVRRRTPTSAPHLFVGLGGAPCSDETLKNLTRWLRARVTTRYPIHPYLLRRSFAMWHLEAHDDLHAVQVLLGQAVAKPPLATAATPLLHAAVASAPIALSEKQHGPLLERAAMPCAFLHRTHVTALHD